MTIVMLTVIIDCFNKIGHKLVLRSWRDGHQVIAKGGAVRQCSRPGAYTVRENVAGARVHGAILTWRCLEPGDIWSFISNIEQHIGAL